MEIDIDSMPGSYSAQRSFHRGFHVRFAAAVARGVTAFFRQSSIAQAHLRRGSQTVQEENLEHLSRLGINPQVVHVIRAYGESGSAGMEREKFQELIRRIRSRQVGLVILARHDRLGRNEPDSELALEAMRSRGVFLMVDGHVYDPSDERDDFVLGIWQKFAEVENRSRTRWLSLSRFAEARKLAERIPLPSGLVWVCAEDEEYLRRLREQGLDWWLDNLSIHRTTASIGRQGVIVAPFPDADVFASVQLRLQWLVDTKSVAAVQSRICLNDLWPRKGMVPVIYAPPLATSVARNGTVAVRISKYRSDAYPLWRPVTRSALWSFFNNPVWRGVYRFQAPSMADPDTRDALEQASRSHQNEVGLT